jgi:uncharacterized protein (TIGR01777 family)
MRVAVSGGSGLVGSALVAALRTAGHTPIPLVRSAPAAGQVLWDPERGLLDAASLAGIEGVVHLAGESLSSVPWTQRRKQRIRESRVRGTALVAETLSQMNPRPRVLVSASAVGYYGNRDDEILTEESPSGSGFLAEVCQAWEAATEPAAAAGVRVVTARFGLVLSRRGGALAKMLVPFRLGLGGRLGSGRQWVSWIALDDAVEVVLLALRSEEIRGAVNVVSPDSVTNADLARALGRALARPAVAAVPVAALRLAMGEMADQMLLASTRVSPAVLLRRDHRFRHPDLAGALLSALA